MAEGPPEGWEGYPGADVPAGAAYWLFSKLFARSSEVNPVGGKLHHAHAAYGLGSA